MQAAALALACRLILIDGTAWPSTGAREG
jgi:hypothetical protein